MPVRQVSERLKVEPNHVYVIPPARQLVIIDSHLNTADFEEPRGRRRPIDYFFRSLAAMHRDCVAVILSGSGTDGAVGVKAIKEQGGLLLVQDPDEAEHDGMPRAAIATGLADLVLSARELAAKLVEYHSNSVQVPQSPEAFSEREAALIQRILTQVQAQTGHDFSQYKRSTVLRRLQRRLQLTEHQTLDTYLLFLRDTPQEAHALFNDLLIGVTNFFRDREAWEALAKQVIPTLFEGKDAGAMVRAWTIGCATGEEAYTLAILLLEHAATLEGGGRDGGVADLCLRPGRGGAGSGARGGLPSRHRGRCLGGAAGALLHQTGRPLPHQARGAGYCARREPQRAARPALLAPGSDLLPQPVDLPAAPLAGAGLGDLPLRPQPRGLSLPGQRRDGRAIEEIVGRSHWEIYPGTETSELGRLLKKAMVERVPVSLEHRYAWEAGRALWLEMRAYPTTDGSLAVFWGDVTERFEAQDALRRSEAKYRTLFESMIEAYCVIEMIFDEHNRPVDFRYLETNPAFEKHATQPMLGKRIKEVVPEFEQFWLDQYGHVAQTGEPVRLEHIVKGLGNQWFHTSAFRLGGAASHKVAVFFMNITERKRAEEALRASEARYHTLFEAMDEAYAVVEVIPDDVGNWVDFRFLEVNSAFYEHTMMENVVGRTAMELLGTPNPRWAEVYGRVAATGEPVRFEEREMTLDRIFDLYVFRLGGPGSRRVAVLFTNITARKRAEEAVRESEARHTFLLALSDALRPLHDPVAVQAAASRLLGEHLGVDRAYYVEINEARSEYVVARDWHRPGVPSHARRYPLADWRMPWLLDGQTWVMRDTERDPAMPDDQRAAYRGNDIGAAVVVPLVKAGRLAATFVVNQRAPRAWTPFDVALVEETAERTWAAVERTRAEAALRESEARLQKIVNVEGVGVLLFREDGTLLSANDTFLRMHGYTRAEAESGTLTWRDFTPAEHVEASERQMAQLHETGRLGPYEKAYLRKDGSRSWLLFSGAALGDGTVVEYCIDVSDRKRAEAALGESEARRLLAVEAAGIADWTYDVLTDTLAFSSPHGYEMHRVALGNRWIEPTSAGGGRVGEGAGGADRAYAGDVQAECAGDH